MYLGCTYVGTYVLTHTIVADGITSRWKTWMLMCIQSDKRVELRSLAAVEAVDLTAFV